MNEQAEPRGTTHEAAQRDSGARDLIYLLDRLEAVIAAATRMPLTSRVLVDEQECLDVVDQIRLALPDELRQARRLVAQREQILAEASEQADQLLARAAEQASQRVHEHQLTLAAEGRAGELVDQARREADEIRRQADAYAYRLLTNVRNRLRLLDDSVQKGLEELASEC